MCDCSSLIIWRILPLYIITTWRKVYIVSLQPGHHWPFQFICEPVYIVYNRWLYVWLFKFNNSMDITPTQYHNLARSLYCYVTTPTSSTFSIYLWAMYIVYNRWLYVWLFKFNNWMDITPAQYHDLARSLHCYIT
jgi:hypothetical protein